MRLEKFSLKISLLALIFVFTQCNEDSFIDDVLVADDALVEISSKGKPGTTGDEGFGNNLSFPVIWSDGTVDIRGGYTETAVIEGPVTTEGVWWYVWGVDPIDPQATVYSCEPDLNNPGFCLDGSVPGDGSSTVYKAYIQKDEKNNWQASNWVDNDDVNVDLINWGDNLESVDWTIRSQVRVEVVLLENLKTTVTQYAMRHVDSWGSDEVHGLQTTSDTTAEVQVGPGNQATVYSDKARFTIQKLNVDKTHDGLISLEWTPGVGWTEPGQNPSELINDPIINENASAETNVKGKIIYGTTWNVRSTNDGEGYYRLTFSFDDGASTSFDGTQFEDISSAKGEDGGEDSGGGTPIIQHQDNLTYIDVLITGKTTGKGGGGGTGGGSGGGSGTGQGSGIGGSGSGSGSGGGGHQ